MNCCPPCPDDLTLDLEAWREAMCCIDPWPFWQWKIPVSSNVKTACDPITREYQYHSKNLGRHEIRQALGRAEQILTRLLGYPPIPKYRKAYIPIEQPIFLSNFGTRYPYPPYHMSRNRFSVTLPDAMILDVGRPVRTSLGEAPVVLSSEFSGNGIYDTFTLTLPISSTLDLETIEVRFIETDRFDKQANESRWKVTPVSWTKDSSGNLIVTGRAWTIASPKLYALANQANLDPTIASNYVTKLEIVHLTRDYERNGKVIIEPKECTCGACKECNSCLDAKFCFGGNDRATFVGLVDQTSDCNCSCRKVVGVCVEYYAGDCTLDWTKTLAQLAVAELGCCICSCDYPCLSELWQDISLKGKERSLTGEMLNNGLGLRMGHYLTYLAIQQYLERKDTVVCW